MSHLPNGPTSDEELLHAWRAGDARAGDLLFRRYQGKVIAYFMRRVGADVEELSQQTLVAVVEGRERILGSFRAYLWGAARNIHLAYLRRKHEQAVLAPDPAHERFAPSWTVLQVAHEGNKALVAALRRLPLDMQSMLELRYWEALSTKEIAATMTKRPGTIRVHLHRARHLLKQTLEEVEREAAKLSTERHRMSRWAREIRAQREANIEDTLG